MSDLEKIVRRLKNLKQNRELSDEVILKMAEEELNKKQLIGSLTFCVSDEEREYAKQMIDNYLNQSTIESEADKDTLKQLVDLQILAERIKSILKTEYLKANPAIPLNMVEQLQDIEKQIIELKEKLGLTQKDKEQAAWIETWDLLKKKALAYFETHKGENHIRCPHCHKMIMLLLKMNDYDAKKSTWFENTTLYNKKVFELFNNNKITKEEAADILGVSIYYIDFINENLYLKHKKEENNAS